MFLRKFILAMQSNRLFFWPSVTATGPLLICGSGYREQWVEDVKEQHFEIDERQKISAERKIGKKKDQEGDLQDEPMVRERSDVYRKCRSTTMLQSYAGTHTDRYGTLTM